MFGHGLLGMLGVAAMLLAAAPAQGQLCTRWSEPRQLGTLDTHLINEASGIAVSRRFPGRLYHNNDSGDGPFFYVSDSRGRGTRRITLSGGFTPQDVEDIALGPCAADTCLFVGDIGDNLARRPTVSFVILPEREHFADSEAPLRTVVARYPEGPQDAESFAVHPNGDLYLITKPFNFLERRAAPARVYRLTAAQLATADGAVQIFELVGTIDLPYLLYMNGLAGQLSTGLDFAPDGSRAMLITYQSLVEINFDFSHGLTPSRTWRPNVDYRVTTHAPLPQSEAIAYGPDGRWVIYDSESVTSDHVAQSPQPVDLGGRAPLFRQDCLDAPAPR
jgi:hypothetical protein